MDNMIFIEDPNDPKYRGMTETDDGVDITMLYRPQLGMDGNEIDGFPKVVRIPKRVGIQQLYDLGSLSSSEDFEPMVACIAKLSNKPRTTLSFMDPADFHRCKQIVVKLLKNGLSRAGLQ